MKDNRFDNFDDEVRDLVLDFERTVMRGESQFYDADELEMITDYYLEVGDKAALHKAVVYAEGMYPDHTGIRLRRAHLLIANERYSQALAMLLRLQEAEPDNTDIAYSLGVAYGAMGDAKEAIRCYLKAATDGWQLARIYANIAEEYAKLEQYGRAVDYYIKSIEADAKDTLTLYDFFDFCNSADRLGDAEAYLARYTAQHPFVKEGWHCLGCAHRNLGHHEAAQEAFELALAIDERFFSAYMDLAVSQEMAGEVGNAATTLLRSLDCADDRSEVYENLASLYGREGNDMMSLLYGRKAVEADPDNGRARATLALALLSTGDPAMAATEVRRALRSEPDEPDVLVAAAYIFESLGDTDRAEGYYDILLSTDCGEQHYLCYAHFLFHHSRWADLIVFCEEMLNMFPDNNVFTTLLCIAFFKTNHYNRARSIAASADRDMVLDLCPEMADSPETATFLTPETKTEK